MQIVKQEFPNRLELETTDVSTQVPTWIVLATDGIGYPSLAAIAAAGKKPWPTSYLPGQPGIDEGMHSMLGTLTAQSDNAGAIGSAFYIETNLASAPVSDNPGALVTTSFLTDASDLRNVWIRKTAATDKIRLTLRY